MYDETKIQRIKDGMVYEAARTAPPPEFPFLPDIPAGRYVDPVFLALEQEGLWRKSWLYAGHLDQLPAAGSYLKWHGTGAPIFLLRDDKHKIRAFYNTCRHRAAPLVQDETGTVAGLTCRYHGWTYNLRGDLINLRDRRDFVGLDMSCRSLIEVRCELLGNWIFINEDIDAEPLEDHLGSIHGDLLEMQPDQLRLVSSKSFEVACNVKVLLDAFLEVYHLKSIHQNTVDRFLDHRGSYITLYKNGHSRMITPNRRPDWVDPGTKGMPSIPTVSEIPKKNNLSFNLYPNLITPVADTGIPFLTFWPKTARTMRIDVHWFSPDWGNGERSPLWDTRLSNFERILEEDTQFAPSIQESVESAGAKGMPLNYQERRIYHWHEEADRRIGIETIPMPLRVPQLLGEFAET